MASGPDHYREAERLIEAARLHTDHFYGEQDALPTLLAAAAHALLAHTAVAAVGPEKDRHEWLDIAR